MPARTPSSFWTVVFVSLLHAGLICVAWPAFETRDAIVEIAGGDGGEGGGGGMGFINPGDGNAPAPPDAPSRVPVAAPEANPIAGPTLQQVIAHCQLDAHDLATQVEQIPESLPHPTPQLDDADVATTVIGPAFDSEPATPLNPHRSELERALAQRGDDANASAAANASESPGTSATGATSSSNAFAGSAAAPSGAGASVGGPAGGPVGRPGAPGTPGIGGGGASGLRPTYPAESLRRGEAGTVVLSIEVLPNGGHGKIELLASSGYTRLDRAALQSAYDATYRPALLDGRPIRFIKRVAVTFRLDEAGR
jgi:protein TonB